MAQQIIVALIVIAAALYVAWRYLPRRWRARLGLAPAPGCGGDEGGSGGCSSCGGCAAAHRPDETQPVAMPPRRS